MTKSPAESIAIAGFVSNWVVYVFTRNSLPCTAPVALYIWP